MSLLLWFHQGSWSAQVFLTPILRSGGSKSFSLPFPPFLFSFHFPFLSNLLFQLIIDKWCLVASVYIWTKCVYSIFLIFSNYIHNIGTQNLLFQCWICAVLKITDLKCPGKWGKDYRNVCMLEVCCYTRALPMGFEFEYLCLPVY